MHGASSLFHLESSSSIHSKRTRLQMAWTHSGEEVSRTWIENWKLMTYWVALMNLATRRIPLLLLEKSTLNYPTTWTTSTTVTTFLNTVTTVLKFYCVSDYFAIAPIRTPNKENSHSRPLTHHDPSIKVRSLDDGSGSDLVRPGSWQRW